jgi:predicted phosphodiesterase
MISAMKIHVLADLHIEFADIQLEPVESDVVVLAGDIHSGVRGIKWARQAFHARPVIYVSGNHEFYGADLPGLTNSLRRAAQESAVIYLENDEAVVAGVRFLGCTLWTDFALYGIADRQAAMDRCRAYMADYSLIRHGTKRRLLTPADTLELHRESVKWLERRLQTRFDGPTVVVTHHAPSAPSQPERFIDSPQGPAFVSALDRLFDGRRVPLWIHGHTHHSVDYEINGTRVVSNQRGYPHETHTGFITNFTVELENRGGKMPRNFCQK